MHVGLGLIHWDRWDLVQARHHLETGIDLSQRTGTHTLKVIASSALACLALYQGKGEEAQTWLESAMTLAHRLDYTEAAGFADLLEAQCHIARGDRDALGGWLAGASTAAGPSIARLVRV